MNIYILTTRNIFAAFALSVVFGFISVPTVGGQTMLPAEKVIKVTDQFGKLGRYMEEDVSGGCQPHELAGWENFPLIKCTYRQPDKKFDAKTATVVMLNPAKEILAKWIVASCVIVRGQPTAANNAAFDVCTAKLKTAIFRASGSQFPVAGIVLEDIYPAGKPDGIQEVYIFRNGLTVNVEGGLVAGETGKFGAAENEIALDPRRKITNAKKYARIQSTSREEYRAYMGSLAEDTDGANWAAVIGKLYRDAWRRSSRTDQPETVEKYRNDLMVAKCYALLGRKPPKR